MRPTQNCSDGSLAEIDLGVDYRCRTGHETEARLGFVAFYTVIGSSSDP